MARTLVYGQKQRNHRSHDVLEAKPNRLLQHDRAVHPPDFAHLPIILFGPYIYSTRRLGDVDQVGQRSVGQLPQQVSRRIEVPFGTENFSYDFSKRALDYGSYERKGRDALQMIECQSPSTAGWTMANLDNGWYIEHYEETGVDEELVPALKGLGIPYDQDHLLSNAPTQNEEFTDAQGIPNNVNFGLLLAVIVLGASFWTRVVIANSSRDGWPGR